MEMESQDGITVRPMRRRDPLFPNARSEAKQYGNNSEGLVYIRQRKQDQLSRSLASCAGYSDSISRREHSNWCDRVEDVHSGNRLG